MNKKLLRNKKPVQAIFGALGLTLMTCGSAVASAFLTIEGPGDNGGQFNGNGTVIDCAVTQTDVGIYLKSVYNAHILKYEVKNCEIGVLISGGGSNHLNNLNVHDNVEDGIQLKDSTKGNLINNSIANNNGGFGIRIIDGSNGNRFIAMAVKENDSGGYDCDDSDFNAIIANGIIGNSVYGVLLESDCDHNTVRSTFIKDTAGLGIQIRGEGNTVQAAKITGSTAEGIKLTGSANLNVVKSNIVSNNGTQGIENGGDDNTFMSNTVNENGKQGIQMELDATGNFIKSNTAKNNGDFDLEDLNPDCDNNKWSTNNFGSANPLTCIE